MSKSNHEDWTTISTNDFSREFPQEVERGY